MPEDSPQPRQSPTMLRRGSSKGVSPLRELRRIDTPPRLSKQGSNAGMNAHNMGACLAGAALMVVAYVLLQRPLAVPKAETAVGAPRSLAHRHKALNILYVVLEDFGVLGTSLFSSPGGAPPGSTPHLERLAANGVAFRRAYCQAPICNPSRSSILVGRRPSHTRIYTNEDRYAAHMPANTPTVVDFLRAADGKASVACAGGKLL
jgi:hypothetical protein